MESINLDVGIECNKEHACTGVVLYCKDTERSIASFWSESDADKTATAINDYDRHIKLIAKQAEQIKMLREALELGIKSMPIAGESDLQDDARFKMMDALSAAEQK